MSLDSLPVEGAYIINFRSHLAYSSRENGQFNIWAKPGDSLMISHISFLRKIVYADSIPKHPDIFLEFDTVRIKQVDVNQDLSKNLNKNMESINSFKPTLYKRMDPGTNLVDQTVIENNRVLRSEASSVSLFSFSPSAIIKNLIKNRKKMQHEKGYNFYRNEEERIKQIKKKNND